MALPQPGQPLSDDELLLLGQQHLRMADREGATDADQAALRDMMPALLRRLREKVEITRDLTELPVLDLGARGIRPLDEQQIEMCLTVPE